MHHLNELHRLNALAGAHTEDERLLIEQLSPALLTEFARQQVSERTRAAIRSIEEQRPLSEIEQEDV